MPDSSLPLLRQRRVRLARAHSFRQLCNGRPVVVLTCGPHRHQLSVLQAIGFDLLVTGNGDWHHGDGITAEFRAASSAIVHTVDGTIHCLEQKQSEVELGIVLKDALPEEFTVRLPGCVRANIRYSTIIHGTMQWLEPHSKSCPATVVNYSREGVCIQSEVAPSVGSEMRFSWLKDGEITHINGMSCWMMSCNGGFMTGCELTKDMGYAITGVTTN